MPLSILWLQHDAAFGFATAAWNWPRPIRDLLSPEAELLTEVETGGWQFKPGDSGPFAHIWYCRTVNQAARIPRGLNFDLAFVKVPLEVYGHEGSSLGDDDRIPSESTLADAEATRRWIKALIEHRWSGCHVCVFEEHHPAPQIGINPRAALPSQDAKKLRDALRKVQEQRQLQLLSRFGVQQVVRWQQELEQSKGSVDLVLRCLTESASTLGSPGAGPSDSRLAEFFPDLALKAALHMPWESLERNWLDAEQVLIKAAPPHAKLIFLTRLLRARNFDWDNRATFNLQNLAGLGLGPLVSRHAIQNYTPVELPFHLPKAVRNDPDWPKVWEGVQRAALNQIDCALELDFDSGTKNALNEIKSLLLGRTAESGPPTNEEKQPYDPGFRWSPEDLSELVDDEIDGCPFEFQENWQRSLLALYPFSIHRDGVQRACLWLAKDIRTNLQCGKILVEFAGDWPKEGWVVFRGISPLTAAKLRRDAQAKHNKPADARAFLDKYFYVLYFWLDGASPQIHAFDAEGIGVPAQVKIGLERYLRTLPPSGERIVGYALAIFDFPESKQQIEIKKERELARSVAGLP